MKCMDIALELIKEAEGFVAKPYYCPAGKLTQGYGRNLEVFPLDEYEQTFLNPDGSVDRDVAADWAMEEVAYCHGVLSSLSFFTKADEVRKAVLIDMCYNIGLSGLLKFKRFIKALDELDYGVAAAEMIDSKWYRQVGNRGIRNVAIMRTGKLA